MIPEIKDFLGLLEKVAPGRLAEPWDNPGLQVGSYSQKITKVFLALDPTLKTLRLALKRNVQLMLTHHPLIFEPISRLDINTFPGNVIHEAVKGGISVVAAHTNFDVARGGINDILADLLDLQHVEVLKEMAGMEGVGLGRIGDLSKPTSLSVVVKNVKRILGAKRLKIVGRGDVKIQRLALTGGSGGSMVSLASKKGADLFLTGDVGYHNALEAEAIGIALIDGGHFCLERTAFGVFAERLKGMVADRGWEVTVEVDEDETDPMHYG
ncbi:MAG: Nif3-like dinuclear metal center hexameric protein [Thermodesulfobacteriota bacterium]|nr:Nif3-like dinuclear metal center hexameric protein [Thermodesulfobacteriota bacterium]